MTFLVTFTVELNKKPSMGVPFGENNTLGIEKDYSILLENSSTSLHKSL